MTHLDEGTIHAWLDGALGEAEAREVASHAATCPQCGALVAEARGLIAGASRILTSLDSTPAGVVPKRPAATVPAKARNFWQASPWVTGIAAAVVLAIGISVWNRPDGAFAPRDAVAPSELPQVAGLKTDSAAPLGYSAPPAVKAPATPAPRAAAAERMRTASGAGAGAASGPATSAAKSAPAAAQPADRAEKVVAAKDGGAVVATAAADMEKKSSEALRPAPVTARDAFAQAMADVRDRTDRADPSLYAGCYRIPDTVQSRLTKAVELAGKAADVVRSAPSAARAQRPVAANLAEPRMLPAGMVRLDTLRDSRGAMIHNPRTSEDMGRWYPERDSVRLVMPVGGTFTLARADRRECPRP